MVLALDLSHVDDLNYLTGADLDDPGYRSLGGLRKGERKGFVKALLVRVLGLEVDSPFRPSHALSLQYTYSGGKR